NGQSHHILKLIAEPIRATQLVKSCARPDAATERLVKQPAIEQQIHTRIRRLDLDCPKQVVPSACYLTEDFIKVCRAVAVHKLTRFVFVFPLSQEKDNLHASA